MSLGLTFTSAVNVRLGRKSGRYFLDGFAERRDLRTEFADHQSIEDGRSVTLLSQLLLNEKPMPHGVPDLGTRPDDFSRNRADCVGQRPGVPVLGNPSDCPSPRTRRLLGLSNGLVEDQNILIHSSDAVDTDVNGLIEQLAQVAFTVRVAFEECDWIELLALSRGEDDTLGAAASRDGKK